MTGGIAAKNHYIDLKNRVVCLFGDITDEDILSIMTAILEMQANDEKHINKLIAKSKIIKLYIYDLNPTSIYLPFGLIDLIISSKAPIHTYAIGKIEDTGLWIFLAGKKRFVYHQTVFIDNYLLEYIIKRNGDFIADSKDPLTQYAEHLISRTNITKELLIEWEKKKSGFCVNASQSIELGIAGSIV